MGAEERRATYYQIPVEPQQQPATHCPTLAKLDHCCLCVGYGYCSDRQCSTDIAQRCFFGPPPSGELQLEPRDPPALWAWAPGAVLVIDRIYYLSGAYQSNSTGPPALQRMAGTLCLTIPKVIVHWRTCMINSGLHPLELAFSALCAGMPRWLTILKTNGGK